MAREGRGLGPISLRPVFSERIWGVESLGAWYPKPEPGRLIGEVWLTAEHCVAEAGPLAGQSLDEIVRLHPEVLGEGRGTQFPLLVKLLYPREWLSVQVHPDDAQARALGEPRGKTECWYVLEAEPDAKLALGFREGIAAAEVKAAIEERRLEEKLRYVPVKAGDMVFVDAGTVHAIGPGVVVLETQQYSDVTFRLYDYGRPRELHVEQGMAVARTQTGAGPVAPREMEGFTRLIAADYFVVDRFEVEEGEGKALGKRGEMQVLVALGEGCLVEGDDGARVALQPGCAVLLPAAAVGYRLVGEGGVPVVRIAEG